MADYNRLIDKIAPQQGHFDFAKFDPYAVNLHLGVESADELNSPVSKISPDIASLVNDILRITG